MKTFDHYELKYTVSNESLMGFVKDLYAGKKPEIDKEKIDELSKQLKDSYNNLNWVKKRGVVNKEISVNAGSLLINDGVSAKITEIKQAIKNNKAVIDKWLNQNKVILTVMDKIISGNVNKVDLIKLNTVQFKRLTSGLKLTPLFREGAKKIPSLSIAEVVETAKLIETIGNTLLEEIKEITNELNKYTNLTYSETLTKIKAAKIDLKQPDVKEGIDVIKTFIKEANSYYGDGNEKDPLDIDEQIYYHRLQLYHLIRALVDWMEQSVK